MQPADHTRRYRAVFTNGLGGATTIAAILTPADAPDAPMIPTLSGWAMLLLSSLLLIALMDRLAQPRRRP